MINSFKLHIISLTILFLLALTHFGCASERSKSSESALPEIYAIKIIGNEVTSRELILNRMSLKPGMRVTKEQLEVDRLRVASLGLFNRVELKVAHSGGRAVILVIVTEKLYIYPFPKLRVDLEDRREITYGAGIHHRNFRGKGEQLTGIAWSGYERGFYFAHKDPWFGKFENVSLSWRVRYDDRILLCVDGCEERYQEVRAGTELRYKLSLDSWAGVILEYEEQTSDVEFYTYLPTSRDRLLVTILEYYRDRRDFRYYPTKGYLLYTFLELNKLTDDSHKFSRHAVDLRGYHPVKNLILAGHFWIISSGGHLPYYRRIELNKTLLRSYREFNSGWMAWAANAEIRFNILSKRYYDFNGLPYIDRFTQNMKFSVEGVLYADGGYTQYSSEDDVMRVDHWGWGFGLQFQVPYLETFHVLTGWNPDRTFSKPVFYAGVGPTF